MPKPWKVLSRRVYQHSPWRAIEDVEFLLPGGQRQTFSLKREGQVVAVFAITADERVVLARQYRPGPDRVLDELPGGGVHPGETPLQAVARELLEETGYQPQQLQPLGPMVDCGYSTMVRHAFIARGCVQVSEPCPDPTEDIEVVLKSVPEFFLQLQSGELSDAEVGWAALFELGYLRPNWLAADEAPAPPMQR